MAVTVTQAAPATTVSRIFKGSYGASGDAAFADVAGSAFAGKRVVCATLALSVTYATNGFALDPTDFGLTRIDGLAVICDGTSGGAAVPFLSTAGASPIVKLVVDDVPTELANATSVTDHTYTVLVIGL